jgi:LytTr DNA-binding domain
LALHELNLALRQCYRPYMVASTEARAPATGPLGTTGPRRELPPLLDRTRDWRWLAFYLAVPATIGLYAALNNWVVLELAGFDTALLFYAGHSFLPWWMSGMFTWACYRALRPWRPHPVVLVTLGGTLSCIAVLPYANWLTGYFAAGWFAGDADGTRAATHIMSQVGFWSFTVRAVVIWIIVNVIFDRVLGLPRYRYDAADAQPAAAMDIANPAPAPDAPALALEAVLATQPVDGHAPGQRLLQRLPIAVRAEEVIALKAEQHYVKVYTASRSFLTLYRFSDAVAEMDPADGSQVHRSYWVRTAAIGRIRRDGRRYELELTNGLVVPISTSNRGLVQALARRAAVPLPPAP